MMMLFLLFLDSCAEGRGGKRAPPGIDHELATQLQHLPEATVEGREPEYTYSTRDIVASARKPEEAAPEPWPAPPDPESRDTGAPRDYAAEFEEPAEEEERAPAFQPPPPPPSPPVTESATAVPSGQQSTSCVTPQWPLVSPWWDEVGPQPRKTHGPCVQGRAGYGWNVPPVIREQDYEVGFIVLPGEGGAAACGVITDQIEKPADPAHRLRGSASGVDGIWTTCMAAELREEGEAHVLQVAALDDTNSAAEPAWEKRKVFLKQLDANSSAEWRWKIRRSTWLGNRKTKLNLTLYAVDLPKEQCEWELAAHTQDRVAVRVFHSPIRAEVTLGGVVGRIPDVLWYPVAVSLLPVAGVLLGLLKRR